MNGKQRIAEQSRIWLWEAFISLLQEKDYEVITISEIADRAQLSRRTFYRSFKSKEALVDYYCDHQIDRYFNLLRTQPALSIKQILVLFLIPG
ncbi:MAG: TetR/AcrR family transcriptional regulator [Oenococcus sp.]|uniref:TetR/AcrR family transcriptional regulator n=1 Tax=Oenococcus sp. TaxID=1979414 RepID=UPI0039EA23D1